MLSGVENKKVVAWGRSRLLEFYLRFALDQVKFEYIVDSNMELYGEPFEGLEIKNPSVLAMEPKDKTIVIIFAASNIAVQEILMHLNSMGYVLGENALLYSDLFLESFLTCLSNVTDLENPVSIDNYEFAKSLSLTLKVPTYTTILCNWLFIELMTDFRDCSIVEVGSFFGGNALMASLFMLIDWVEGKKPFYVLDSFEGLHGISASDSGALKTGDCKMYWPYESIVSMFSSFPNVNLLRGTVPDVFQYLNPCEKYGLVFYDCDLYEPAKETFGYFWDRIIPGGHLLVHDYVSSSRGDTQGVKKATDEFFVDKDVKGHVIWETTCALIKKEK